MIELGLLLLLISLIIGFSKMGQWDKFFRMGFLMFVAGVFIIGNIFIPTVTYREAYLATEILDSRDIIKFEKMMLIVKLTHDRPYTFMGDKVEYIVGNFDFNKKGKTYSQNENHYNNKENKFNNLIEMGV